MARARVARPAGRNVSAREGSIAKLRRRRSAPQSRNSAAGASRRNAIAAAAIASACSAAAAGFDLCAGRTGDPTIAVAARSAAAFLRSVQEAAARLVGVDARPRARTCDRLRWEWLASTATVLDGAPDERLASECARILAGVDVTMATGLAAEIAARFQAALAEAHSLAWAIGRMRRSAFAAVHG